MAYKTLNDVANPIFAKGSVKIWYVKKEWSRVFCFGPTGAAEQGIKFCPGGPAPTHQLLGEIVGADLNVLFNVLQGENWSPNGEARDLVRDIGHTSISVGDVIEKDGEYWMVDNFGFTKVISV
jgi:hypothetical protein